MTTSATIPSEVTLFKNVNIFDGKRDQLLIVVHGNPLTDLALVVDLEQNFLVIMRDGVINKNTLNGAKQRSSKYVQDHLQNPRRAERFN